MKRKNMLPYIEVFFFSQMVKEEVWFSWDIMPVKVKCGAKCLNSENISADAFYDAFKKHFINILSLKQGLDIKELIYLF